MNRDRNKSLVKSNGTRTILFLPHILPWWPRFQPDSSAASPVPWVYLISCRQLLCPFLLSRLVPSSLWRLASSASIPSLFAWQMEPKLLWRFPQLAWWWEERQVARNLEIMKSLAAIENFNSKEYQFYNSLKCSLKCSYEWNLAGNSFWHLRWLIKTPFA